MIKSFSAVTREIENADAAIAEIKAGLNLEKNQLKNSLGIISCFSDFGETGVLKAICKSLPFDCVGATSCLCSASGEIDQIIFAITVLTSDDCSFKATAIPITENYKDSINSCLGGLLEQSGEKPAFFLSYFPLMENVSGDMILEAIDAVSGGIPLFGTTALDHKFDYSTAKTIYNGGMYREMAVLGAIYGNPKLSFEIASFEESKIRKQKAIITESHDNILIGINGKKALDYFSELGYTREELEVGLGLAPIVIDHKDGTKPIARSVFALTEEGHAICGGVMPVNASMTVARIDKDDVLHTTENTLKSFISKDCLLLSYSCMARFVILGSNNKEEAEIIKKIAGDTPFHFACSGGEICPLPDAEGKMKNYFHNYTNIFCKLE